jgi:uncharacterized protein YegP (UPF0339 family)
VRKNGTNSNRFEHKSSRKGESYFVLNAANGEVVGASEMYVSKQGMEIGITSVGRNAPRYL